MKLIPRAAAAALPIFVLGNLALPGAPRARLAADTTRAMRADTARAPQADTARVTPAGQPPLTILFRENYPRIREVFNAASDRPRVLVLLSPT